MRYIFAMALLTLGLTAAGQGFRFPETCDTRYERVFRDNLWNSSRNITGVRQDSISRSFAEAYGRFKSGDFHDVGDAAKEWGAGAVTSSIRHLERISFAGSFSFDQTEMYDACGSMFIKPGSYPVDVLEFTPGHKTLQTYAFNGGVSYDVADGWRIGAKMDFESANIAKRKDLRHTNKRLEMTVAPGFMFHRGKFAVGASYIFEKTSETIEAEQVGTSESSYWAFLDKGMIYGVHSVWTGSGIHLKDNGVNGFPVNDFSNGIALQMQYGTLFAEIEYLDTRGRIGEKEYIWFTFPGNKVGAVLGCVLYDSAARHNLSLRFRRDGLEMDENILEQITENGVNTVLNHGSNRILSREKWSLSPEYEVVLPMLEMRFGAGLEWMNSVSSQMYPYVYGQSMFTYGAGAELIFHMERFDIRVAAAVKGGKVEEDSKLVSEDSGVMEEPFRLQEWYQQSIDYQTAPKLDTFGALRYKFRNGMYLEGSVNILNKGKFHDLTGEFHDRTELKLKLGYNF